MIVDPAYDVGGLLDILAADDMRCVGVLASHYHADHVGGDLMGYPIEGITTLLEQGPGTGPRAEGREPMGEPRSPASGATTWSSTTAPTS